MSVNSATNLIWRSIQLTILCNILAKTHFRKPWASFPYSLLKKEDVSDTVQTLFIIGLTHQDGTYFGLMPYSIIYFAYISSGRGEIVLKKARQWSLLEEGAIFDGTEYNFWHSCSISLPPPKFSVRPEQPHLSALLPSSINASPRVCFLGEHSSGPLEISTWAGGCHKSVLFAKAKRPNSII